MDGKNRRIDNELRESINELRRRAVRDRFDLHMLYKESLQLMCDLHSAPYGFAVVPSDRVNSNLWTVISAYPPSKKSRASATKINQVFDPFADELKEQSACEQKTSAISAEPDQEEVVAENELGLPITLSGNLTVLSRVYNSRAAESVSLKDIEEISEQLTYRFEWTRFSQLLVVPILDARGVYCLVCLANSPHEYMPQVVRRLWPFLTTVACLHRMMLQNPDDVITSEALAEESEARGALKKEIDTAEHWSKMYFMLEEQSPLGLVELDENLRITRFNPEAERLFLMPKESILGQDISEIIPESFPNQHRIQTFSMFPGEQENNKAIRLFGQTGAGAQVPIMVSSITYQRNHQRQRLLIITDCTELDVVKQEQRAQVQRFRTLAQLAPAGILQTDAQWQTIYVNDRWCEICHREVDEIEQLGWISSFYYEEVGTTLQNLRQAMVIGKEFKGQCRMQSPIGDIIWVDLHARPLYTPKGEMSGFLATIIDCTYRYETEQELRRLAERDTLTGLANRMLFNDRLNHALARAKRSGSLALLSLDLDEFKHVNDSMGHDAGDQLLIQVSERLVGCVRESDTIARVGGDEFLILLEDITNADIAPKLSEKLLKRLSDPFIIQNQEVFISGSIGIAFAVGGQGQIDSRAILKQVDLALYRAKELGRNNFQYYSPEFELSTKDKLYLGNSLHRALERSEFTVFYQLQADVKSNEIVGSEALIRWVHPERGLLAPGEFISLLEETGIIVPVSRWLVTEAFRQQRQWINSGLLSPDSHVAINLSPRLLRDQNFFKHFKEALFESGLKGSNIMVEITESVIFERSDSTDFVLSAFQELGVVIALDDFGTGYSSLSYLKKFPIKTLKIDRTFLRDLLTDPEDAAITRGIIQLAHSLNLDVVAEGVDDPEKVTKLREWGCHYYQGYYLNKPMSVEATDALLRRSQDTCLVS